MGIRVIVEFVSVPNPSLITSLGMSITGRSSILPLIFAEGTSEQIQKLSDNSAVKSISYDAPVINQCSTFNK